ncbi:MAG: hypothetical protein QOK06_3003 [Acidimicrobiaceae bacterium]|jgi:hypothetical protein
MFGQWKCKEPRSNGPAPEELRLAARLDPGGVFPVQRLRSRCPTDHEGGGLVEDNQMASASVLHIANNHHQLPAKG